MTTKDNRCKHCAKPFINRERLSQHLRDSHKFMCSGCDEWFGKDTPKKMIDEFAFCPPCYREQL